MPNRIPGTTDQVGTNRLLVDYAGNGDYDDLQAALDAAAVYATASNRWLVQVAPGVYSGQFTLKDYVDVAGLAHGPAAHLKRVDSGPLFTNAAACTLSNLKLETLDAPVISLPAGFAGEMWLDKILIDQAALDVAALSVAAGVLRVFRARLLAGGAAALGGGALEIWHSLLRNQALSSGGANAALYVSGGVLNLYHTVVENTGAAGYGIYLSGAAATVKAYHSTFRKKDTTYAIHATANPTPVTLAGCSGNAALHPYLSGYLNYVYDGAI